MSMSYQIDWFKGQIEDYFKTPKGSAIIDDIVKNNKTIVVVDYDDIFEWNEALAKDLILKAAEGAEAIHRAIDDVVLVANLNKRKEFELVFVGKKIPVIQLHEIDANCIDKMFKFFGIVTHTSDVQPEYTEAVFRCLSCGDVTSPIPQDGHTIIRPLGQCEGCGEKHPRWEIVDSMSKFVNYQLFTLQESYKNLASRMPRFIHCEIHERCLMNIAQCGDECDIIGIVNVEKPKDSSKRATFIIEVLSINKLRKDPSQIELKPEEIETIHNLSKEPDIYKKLTRSIAPALYGLQEEKEALLLALAGTPQVVKGGTVRRGNIHVLLLGDYGTGKSQLLKFAADVAPRGVYAVSQGASKVGLTATVQKINDRWEVYAGAVVLADEGLASLDEIEKMNDDDKTILHEAMEQQTVTIWKATIHATLSAKASIVAAANPVLGKYDREVSVMENAKNIPAGVLDRFDIILVLLREYSISHAEEIADFVLSETCDNSVIDMDLFRKYIAYSKRINPKLSKDAEKAIKQYYLDIFHNATVDPMKFMAISTRQLESLIRVTCAHARLLLKEQADVNDFEAIKPLFDRFLKNIGYDVVGLAQGVPTIISDIAVEVVKLLKSEGPMAFSEVKAKFQELYAGKIEISKLEKAWKHAVTGNVIYKEGAKTLDGEEKYCAT